MDERSTAGRTAQAASPDAGSEDDHGREVEAGERFEFGKNWQRFLSVLDDERIDAAQASLTAMLEVESLAGKSFLDAGSGSGLFSLVARRLGAARLRSFDFDPSSVACTRELRRRFFPDDSRWVVEQGSVLDQDYLRRLGTFDVVYSWGVLHHTGAMWQALANVDALVAPGGLLYIAIYNQQGLTSQVWHRAKQIYNRLPAPLKGPFALATMAPREVGSAMKHLLRGRPGDYLRLWTEAARGRGMSKWYDIIDWIGGYPFEVAKPEEIFDFYRARGYALRQLKTCGGGLGCNEYLFEKA